MTAMIALEWSHTDHLARSSIAQETKTSHPYAFRPKSRTRDHHPDPQSEVWGRFYNDHILVERIIITDFITYLLQLFINYYYYLYSQTSESIVFLSTPIDINME